MSYAEFLAGKVPRTLERGLLDIPRLSSHLFGFQAPCVEFALRVGSVGMFLDTGLGKTLIQLEYCEHARTATNGYALILTPLAVARQIEREGRKFGYKVKVIHDQSEAIEGINICNYDRLHLIDPSAFGVVTLDEGSVLKNFSGKTSRALVLWSNPGDVVLSPFMGIGSEGYCALKAGRKFIGTELKAEYFRQAVENLKGASSQTDLFSGAA